MHVKVYISIDVSLTIRNKLESIQQLLLIAVGLLICLVITKSGSATCQCEYLLKADPPIESPTASISAADLTV